MAEAVLLFKQQRQATNPANNENANVIHDASSARSRRVITMPRRLPKIDEDILFDVQYQPDPLVLHVDRLYEHPSTRSSTVCGHIVSTFSNTSKSGGTFTLTCQTSTPSDSGDTSLSTLSCLANIRPSNYASIQYELRQDTLTKEHVLKRIDRNEVYEPRVLAGDHAVHQLHAERATRLAKESPPSYSANADTDTYTADKVTDSSTSVSRRLAADSNDILDLFVVWTPEAESVAGSANAMSLYMDLVVDEANYVLESSDVELRLRIVHAMCMIDSR